MLEESMCRMISDSLKRRSSWDFRMSGFPQGARILYRRVFGTLQQCDLCFSIVYRLLYLLPRRYHLLVQELIQLLLLR
jgi:hypothetical protein